MSISQLAPRDKVEIVQLREMQLEGKRIETGELFSRTVKYFPKLTSVELQRRTPSETLFWPGRFRFDLNSLKRKGQAVNPVRGYWQITTSGTQRLASANAPPAKPAPKLTHNIKEAADLLFDTAKYIKKKEIPATIIVGKNEMTIRLGKNIKRTTVERAPVTAGP